MTEHATQENELQKLQSIFEKVEEGKRKLVDKLIHDAAFLAGENDKLREIISQVGMIKVHPKDSSLQKPTEAGKQYLKNLATYAIVIKALNSVLTKNTVEDDDEFDKFVKEGQADDEV